MVPALPRANTTPWVATAKSPPPGFVFGFSDHLTDKNPCINTIQLTVNHRNAAVEFAFIVKGSENSASGYNKGVYTVTPAMTLDFIGAESINR